MPDLTTLGMQLCRPADRVFFGCVKTQAAARIISCLFIWQGMCALLAIFFTPGTTIPQDPICHGDSICQAIVISQKTHHPSHLLDSSSSAQDASHLHNSSTLKGGTHLNGDRMYSTTKSSTGTPSEGPSSVSSTSGGSAEDSTSSSGGSDSERTSAVGEKDSRTDSTTDSSKEHSSPYSSKDPSSNKERVMLAAPKLTAVSMFLEQVETVFRLTAMWAGMRGYAGVALQSTEYLRVLLVYTVSYTTCLLLKFFRLPVICSEFPNAECDNARMIVIGYTGFQFFWFSYLSFILWSCVEKIEDSNPFSFLGEGLIPGQEMREVGANLGAAVAATRAAGPGGFRQNTLQDQPNPTAHQPVPIEPFSGEAHRLE